MERRFNIAEGKYQNTCVLLARALMEIYGSPPSKFLFQPAHLAELKTRIEEFLQSFGGFVSIHFLKKAYENALEGVGLFGEQFMDLVYAEEKPVEQGPEGFIYLMALGHCMSLVRSGEFFFAMDQFGAILFDVPESLDRVLECPIIIRGIEYFPVFQSRKM